MANLETYLERRYIKKSLILLQGFFKEQNCVLLFAFNIYIHIYYIIFGAYLECPQISLKQD